MHAKSPSPLLGLALGDALGGPFETHPPTSPALLAWDGSFRPWDINSLQPERAPGDWTDDTAMALQLAEALIEAETYDPLRTLRRYVAWYQAGDCRGIGKATAEALSRVLRGAHWDTCGVPHAEGNGTAMRATPIGAFFHKAPLTAAYMARVDARLTHQSLEAAEGSAAVALAVAFLCDGYPKEQVLAPVIALLQHSRVQEGLQKVQNIGDLSAEETLMTLVQWGTKAHVVQTVPAAFLSFLSASSYSEAVGVAIRAGGDTDTTAAITGALAGSYYGRYGLEGYLPKLESAQHIARVNDLLLSLAPKDFYGSPLDN